MQKKKQKIQNLKKVIVLLIVIAIILMILALVIYNNPTDRKLRYIYNTKKVGTINIMPTNVNKIFTDYKFNIEQRSIYKAMDVFVNEYVEKYYLAIKDLNKEQISNYFNKNKSVIEKELGIISEEIFSKFAENLKNNLNGESFELVSYTISPESVKKTSRKLNYVIIVKYSNNQKIGFELTILNSVNKNKTPISYEACTDEEILSYEYVPNDYETPDDIEPIGRVL